MKNIKLLGDRVIVKHHGYEEEENSGWKFIETEHDKARKGEVLAVGPGINGLSMTVKEGDIVLYGKDAGMELTVEGQKVLIMRESDIYTSIENEEKD
jgi:chaperonin GroES